MLEEIKARNNSHFVSICNSETRCFHKSSNLMLISYKRSPSGACPKVMIFRFGDSL